MFRCAMAQRPGEVHNNPDQVASSGTAQQFADHCELAVAKLDHVTVLDWTIVRG